MEWVVVTKATILAACLLAACTYSASFEDCEVACATDSSCPDGLSCGTEGLCRSPGQTRACSAILGDAGSDAPSDPPSCAGLAASCGPIGTEDCCSTATPIPGGAFYRGYDVATDGMYSDMSYPATVSPFVLDRFEVTVGRFRKFVEAGMGTRASPPPNGAGARALSGATNQGGWDPTWTSSLVADAAALAAAVKCDASRQSWTDVAGGDESLPINCITWYEAFAFCAWDGGFLPTEAEWNYAAAGGSEQRAYPWSSPASSLVIDCSHANYGNNGPPYCVDAPSGAVNRVGSESPAGDGKYGQADLAGNVWEWTLDGYQDPYESPCDDCASLTATASRVLRGGSLFDAAPFLRAYRDPVAPDSRGFNVGVRCVRSAR